MAFAAKVDLIGLTTVTGLSSAIVTRANAQNATTQVLQIHGSDGSYIGDEAYGSVKAPSVEYAITGTGNLSNVHLGSVYHSEGTGTSAKPYAVSKVHVTTGPGAEPILTAEGVQIENGATRAVCTYSIGNIEIGPERHARTFGAFTYTESTALTLQGAEFDANVNLQPATVNGDPVGSDAVEGIETVAATFWTNDETSAPNVTASAGWSNPGGWTCVGADSQMFVWTTTFQKYLTASKAAEPNT